VPNDHADQLGNTRRNITEVNKQNLSYQSNAKCCSLRFMLLLLFLHTQYHHRRHVFRTTKNELCEFSVHPETILNSGFKTKCFLVYVFPMYFFLSYPSPFPVLDPILGHATVHRPLTAEAQVRTQVNPCRMWCAKQHTGTSFLQVLWFPLSLYQIVSSFYCRDEFLIKCLAFVVFYIDYFLISYIHILYLLC
jgi:hypothetical protein